MTDAPSYPSPSSPQATRTSSLAITSLIAGIFSWLGVPLLGAIVAVITGHMAKNEIRSSFGRVTGEDLATIGLILGYVQLVLSLVLLCVVLVFVALGLAAPLLCIPFFGNEFVHTLGI